MNTFSVVKDKNKKLVMSIGKFIERYGTEGRCWEHLYTVRFCENPQFVCPRCGGTAFYFLKSRHLASILATPPVLYYAPDDEAELKG